MYCPRFIYDMAVARSAAEYLGAELALETYAKKYAEGLTELYSEIALISITEPAESMLQFLSEIEAGELAVELLNDYVYFELLLRRCWQTTQDEADVWLAGRPGKNT